MLHTPAAVCTVLLPFGFVMESVCKEAISIKYVMTGLFS